MCLADYDLPKRQRPKLFVLCKEAGRCARLAKLSGIIGYLACSDEVEVSILDRVEYVTPKQRACLQPLYML